jgi:hypothetical protein
MELKLNIDGKLKQRLAFCAERRGVSAEELAIAYIEDWALLDYADAMGRHTRRHVYRDGPIAFDPIAAKSAAKLEREFAVKEVS